MRQEDGIMKQIIIALGREFGSGGHVIAKKLAEHYNIPVSYTHLTLPTKA